MSDTSEVHAWQVERVPTGVPNLDRVIDGGLTRGSMLLIVGGPGTGKTVLAEQMAFHWAARGLNVLWLVTLGEPNEKFLTNISEMAFYDRGQIGAGIQLINLTRFLRLGFEENLNAIRETVRAGDYSFVVIDGFQSLRCFLEDVREVRLFLSELSAELALKGITLIVSADADPERYWEGPEFTMADGIIALERILVEGCERRLLHTLKLRGRPAIGGYHSYTIDNAGIHVHPRLESILPPAPSAYGQARLAFDLPALDRMTGGGLREGSATLLVGTPGTGKSVLACHFLAAGLAQGEPCLQLSFFENEQRMLARADAFGLPLRQARETGLLQMMTYEPGRCDPDACAEDILQTVERRGIRRLVIDGIDPLERELAPSGRRLEYLSALAGYLRMHGVTSLFTYELPALLGPVATSLEPFVSQVAANLMLLRLAEVEGRLRHFLAIVKMRYAQHSDAIAELLFTDGELTVVERPALEDVALAGVSAVSGR